MDNIERLNKLAQEAVDKFNDKLHANTLELVLGAMVAKKGVTEVRKILLMYARNLKYF